jgi:S-DNA-T family DNA segregation ATPase FtsK/SpoIIIE
MYWRVPAWAAIAWWLIRSLGRLIAAAARRWRITAPTVALLILWAEIGTTGLLVLVYVLVIVAGLWWRLHPVTYRRWVWWPIRNRYRRLTLRARWVHAMTTVGLGVRLDGQLTVPRLATVTTMRGRERVTVVLVAGQLVDDLAAVTDRIAEALSAHHVTVAAGARFGEAVLTLWQTDPLATVVPALPVPQVLDPTGLPVGLRDDGERFLLSLSGTHILVAGSTGAGKGSVVWATLSALAVGIRDGLVDVWAIDPKGGMELGAGAGMFRRFAYRNPADAADLLDDAAVLVRARASRMKGTARIHTPTPAQPLVVIVIDELAALTAYLVDKTAKERIRTALGVVLTQGRAVGVHVIAALQDARKEVLGYRNLFPTRIALRLAETAEVDLVLGEGARERGAACDRISQTTPGVGYVIEDGSTMPVRVRFAYLTDTDIAVLADTYPAPETPAGLRCTTMDTPWGGGGPWPR